MTNDNIRDRDLDRKSCDTLLELIEIELLYAAAELRAAKDDASSQIRALQHVEQALEIIRAQRARNAAD
ncbi:cobalamin biosynthesis protein CbiD [Rhodoblastus acidophilus]|uniref:hypothetical protein n=1 Tax=Rhodoblastus acidophilus TaxID=1074 RepID=UPI002224CB54|nr:hypothetical protein [Rhodoblastus acidophilus]MCW2284917.1 cobalamin biosynthesis protein CbiD [Rhodoblastus acidophilus]MCW2333793.1 cobalamin biosynthesis protein CbiD [Rhodoblastus acidophilus]